MTSAAYDHDAGGARAADALMNLEAEAALLGALLSNNKAVDRVIDILRAEHFADPVHGRIYAAIVETVDAGRQANPITLKGRFDQDDALKPHGGAAYLMRLVAATVTVINAPDYAREIRECFVRRQLIDIGESIVITARDRTIDDIQAVIDAAHADLDAATEGADPDAGLAAADVGANAAMQAIQDAYNRGGSLVGRSTGLADLDATCGGMEDTNLILLAARPSMGKSALARAIAWHDAQTPGGRPALFTLEMSQVQQHMALMSSMTGIDLQRIRLGRIGRDEWAALEAARARIAATGLMIDERPAARLSQIRSAVRRLGSANRPTLIIVDHGGLMRPDRQHPRKVDEISEISAGLKQLAKDEGVPVLALWQLSRAVEGRDDKRPVLSDLRDSGTLEQDADQVWFLYREEYYLSKSEPRPLLSESDDKYQDRMNRWEDRMAAARGIAEILVQKNRMGPTGTCRLHFNGPTTRFSNLAQHEMAV